MSIDPEDLENQPLDEKNMVSLPRRKIVPRRGKIIRREYETPKNSIDQIHITAMDNNQVEVLCRINRKGIKSKHRRITIFLPDKEKVKEKIRCESLMGKHLIDGSVVEPNPLTNKQLDAKTEKWFNRYIRQEISKFFRRKRKPQPLKLKVPEEIMFE